MSNIIEIALLDMSDSGQFGTCANAELIVNKLSLNSIMGIKTDLYWTLLVMVVSETTIDPNPNIEIIPAMKQKNVALEISNKFKYSTLENWANKICFSTKSHETTYFVNKILEPENQGIQPGFN